MGLALKESKIVLDFATQDPNGSKHAPADTASKFAKIAVQPKDDETVKEEVSSESASDFNDISQIKIMNPTELCEDLEANAFGVTNLMSMEDLADSGIKH